MEDGTIARNMTYGMEDYVNNIVQTYKDLCYAATGKRVVLRKAMTPFIDDGPLTVNAKTPVAEGPCILCDYCGNTFPDSDEVKFEDYKKVYERLKNFKIPERNVTPAKVGSTASGTGGALCEEAPDLHSSASSLLMMILFAGRMARFDLRLPTIRLSSYVTRWTSYNDAHIYRLVCFIETTLGYRQEGIIADAVDLLRTVGYADADFAGCYETLRSTTGGHLCIEGPKSHFPLHAVSKRQDSTATSTPEA